MVEQRVRPYTWAAIKKHRENYTAYKQTYKSTLRSPNDIELKLDLQKCEDNLPIISVVIAREQAKFEVRICFLLLFYFKELYYDENYIHSYCQKNRIV